MKTKQLLSWVRHGATFTFVCASLATAQADSSTIRVALQNTGVDPDAAGSIITRFKSSSSQLTLQASKLTPGQNYALTVGEVPEATLKADNNGRVRATFVTKSKKNPLDFDPRGQLVALRDGANSVLEAVVSGEGEPAGINVDERAKLARVAGTGEATASYKALGSGQRTFSVKVENVAFGDWSVFVNGILRGMLNVYSRQSTLTFDSNPTKPGRLLLDFDPRGQVVDLGLGTNLMFTGKLEAKAKNVNLATPSASLAYIPSTGADASGTARAKSRVDSDARRRFSIEIEDVPVGAYELLVNGALEGTINVTTTASGTEGEIEFSSRADDSDELPLTFDPATSVFKIRSGGVVYFEGALTGSIGGTNGGGGTTPGGSGLAPGSFAGLTLNLDDQPGGDLMEFTTATTGVDLGVDPDPFTYLFTLLNSSQAKVTVTEGDKRDMYVFTFASASAGSWVRDEYRDGVFKDRDTGPFTVVSGGGAGGTNNPPGGGSGSSSTSFSESLSSTGLDGNASGHADFEIDANGRRKFSVEIEDVPAGLYELWIGGVRRGTIGVTLVAGKTKGELEFANPTDDADKVKLTFEPRGQFIEIKKSTGLYFAHLFGFGDVFGGGGGGTNNVLVVPSDIELPLFNLGVSPGASAKAEFKTDDEGRRSFEVEIEDAPLGTYALRVGGVQVGSINVVNTSNGTRGQIEFEDDDGGDHLPLTFNPLGQAITISRDGVDYFQRVFPADN